MSNLPRSKSAPHPMPALRSFTSGGSSRPELPRSTSHQVIQPKSKSYYYQATKPDFYRPLISPRVERRDPFNAAGFFPSSFGDIEGGDESSWWLGEQQQQEEDSSAGRSNSRWTSGTEEVGSNGVNWQMSDEMTRETIKSADKMGILSIEGLFAGDDDERYHHLVSPYSDEEPVDHESLYLSLCARRKGQGVEVVDSDKTFGELFLRG
ncbi:hypothetical protein Moror_913 [Moniliophthora roreri MCA 2997]|uniref:Uncharacterized protein n=1 Tax=Moniliophthora roreri (strain MCA 2997) TaxID=1381753 RepID=V2XZM2_MONRO|nr:hypothetical protein Moror_913 [Moniliophthora roreri MCA 2997]